MKFNLEIRKKLLGATQPQIRVLVLHDNVHTCILIDAHTVHPSEN